MSQYPDAIDPDQVGEYPALITTPSTITKRRASSLKTPTAPSRHWC